MGAKRGGIWAAVAVIAIVGLAGCGGDDDGSKSGSGVTNSTAAPTTATPTSATAIQPVTYQTKVFTPPLDFTVPAYVASKPVEDSAHFVTFVASSNQRAIRIVNPVAIYAPGASTTSPVPADYPTYLDSLKANGAAVSDRAETTVDGHKATLFTAVTGDALDGTLGCPEPDLAADACFGLQPDYTLRIAVIETDTGPLLMWLRLHANVNNMPDEAARFDKFLAGVHFASRTPEAAPAVDSKFDGTYTWTLSKDDAAQDPNGKPEDLASYPWVFTVELRDGRSKTHITYGDGEPDQEYRATYDVSGDRITFHNSEGDEAFTVVQDADGTLHLTAIQPMNSGDAFVNTTKPWVKQS
jgi:hypothetical protein